MRRTIKFLLDNSLFLIIGAVGGLVWANIDESSYKAFLHIKILPDNGHFGYLHGDHYSFDLHYLINDVCMALFFAIAGKEVWEATFPGGPLNNPRKAATPLFATVGGMAGPALTYIALVAMVGELDLLGNGWAIPCATDIAFSYMVARIVFGGGHPAIPFLLLLAIADDALGLIILAVFYPSGPVAPAWLLLAVAAIFVGLLMKKNRIGHWLPYLMIPGVMSWCAFAKAGLHPALGLLPIIPTLPHAHVDTGLFDWSKKDKDDTLTAFEHALKPPVEIILGLFGLLNAGVVFSAVGNATYFVLAGLMIGKPLGIWLCGYLGGKVMGFGLPEGMNYKDLFILGCAAGIGFTVALFVAGVAFPKGDVQDAAKMGALGSFAAALMTIAAGKILGVKRVQAADGADDHGHH